jgi:hypothetical protein
MTRYQQSSLKDGKRRPINFLWLVKWGGGSKAVPQHTYGGALTRGKWPEVPTGQGAGWAPEPVWTQRL